MVVIKKSLAEKLQVRDEDAPPMVDQYFDTLYDLLMAINDLPNVRVLIEAYMLGRGCENPSEKIEELHKLW